MKRRDFIVLLGGATAAWPLAAGAQQAAMPVIGLLFGASRAGLEPYLPAFLASLKEFGYVDGQNVAIEYRLAEGQYERLPALAIDLVGRNVDVIAAFAPPAARVRPLKFLSFSRSEPTRLSSASSQVSIGPVAMQRVRPS